MRIVTRLALIFAGAGMTLLQSGCVGPQSGAMLADHAWHTERQVAQSNRTAACTLFSSARPFSSGAGLDQVRIIIHRNGIVSLQSTQDAFDTKIRAQIGVRVDDHAAMLAPKAGITPRELTFSAAESTKLIDQLKTGRVARIQVALAPRKELLSTTFSLDEFPEALQEYRMCEVVRAEQAASNDTPGRRRATN